MKLSYNQLVQKWTQKAILKFTTEKIASVQPAHYVQITRPLIDELDIWDTARRSNAEKLAKGQLSLFEDEVKKQALAEIEKEEERILKLPQSTIFVSTVAGMKHKDWKTILEMEVSIDTAVYFLRNCHQLESMNFELEDFPHYLSWTTLARKVLEYKDNFLYKNPNPLELEDNFTRLEKDIENEHKANPSKDAYIKPLSREYDDDVVLRKTVKEDDEPAKVKIDDVVEEIAGVEAPKPKKKRSSR